MYLITALITALTSLLIVISLGLVVTVPVALATPGEWEASKNDFIDMFKNWIIIIGLIATADGILTVIS